MAETVRIDIITNLVDNAFQKLNQNLEQINGRVKGINQVFSRVGAIENFNQKMNEVTSAVEKGFIKQSTVDSFYKVSDAVQVISNKL